MTLKCTRKINTIKMVPNLPHNTWGSLGLSLGGRVYMLTREGDILMLRRDFSAWDVYPGKLPNREGVRRVIALSGTRQASEIDKMIIFFFIGV